MTLTRKKQNGEKKKSTFIVPSSLAQHVSNYILALTAAIGEPTGPFIKGTPSCKATKSSKFINQVMGKNLVYCIGKDVTSTVGLENPESYTRHSIRQMGGATHTKCSKHLVGKVCPQLKNMSMNWNQVQKPWRLFSQKLCQ